MPTVDETFDAVISGDNSRVIQFHHPWLKIFAQNDSGHASLLIRADLPPDLMVGDARGFSIKTSREAGDNYIQVTSDQPGCPPIFPKLAAFVIEKTSSGKSVAEALLLLAVAVQDLKRFFSRRPGRLTHEQAQGLFGEIQVLSRLIEHEVPLDQAVSAWKGPFSRKGDGLHDFTFVDGYGIEVKSSSQPATDVRVSSSTQIVPDEVGLALVVVPVETTPDPVSGSADLAEAVAGLRSLVAGSPFASEHVETALAEFGADFEDEFYQRWRFVPGAWKIYEVVEGFPFMAAEDIPKGIFRLTYSLALADLQSFETVAEHLLQRIGAING